MLDVIITSTCRPTIKKTIQSFLKSVDTHENFRFIIHIDVLSVDYLNKEIEFLEAIGRDNDIDLNIKINMFPGSDVFKNHCNALRYLFNEIKTELYFHLEDDWIFLKKIKLDLLIDLMAKEQYINQIRFSKERIKEKSWLYHLYNDVTDESLKPNLSCIINDIPMVQVPVWSFNPHIGRTKIVKQIKMSDMCSYPESYFCKKYFEIMQENGVYVYGQIGDSKFVKDIGRNLLLQYARKIKYVLSGKRNAEYIYG